MIKNNNEYHDSVERVNEILRDKDFRDQARELWDLVEQIYNYEDRIDED